IELGAALVVVEPARPAMDDPDVVLLVGPDADRPAQQPVVGKRLGPERIDLVSRRLDARALRLGLALPRPLTDAETDDGRGKHRAGDQLVILPDLDHPCLPKRAPTASFRAALSHCRRHARAWTAHTAHTISLG